MALPGPLPVTPVQRPQDDAFFLRLNQRFTAEVLQVNGQEAVVSIQGIPVVARLSSAEQASALIERQFTQFIVRDLSDQMVTLQLVNSPGSPGPLPLRSASDLAAELVEQAGASPTPANLQLARAALTVGLPVQLELLDEMAAALTARGAWGQEEALAAAWLKAQGLPVSAGAVSLALEHHPDLAEAAGRLLARLDAFLSRPGIPAELAGTAAAARSTLMRLVLELSRPVPQLAEQLRAVISLAGSSVEAGLSHFDPRGDRRQSAEQNGQGLLIFARLRNLLLPAGSSPLLDALDPFLEGMRWTHFLNARVDTPYTPSQWTSLELPVGLVSPGAGGRLPPNEMRLARLRIARREDPEKSSIDPNYTRLVLQVEVGDQQTLQVDLSIANRQVAAEITASTQALADAAQLELAGLSQGLSRVGFILQRSLCAVGLPLPWPCLPDDRLSEHGLNPVDLTA